MKGVESMRVGMVKENTTVKYVVDNRTLEFRVLGRHKAIITNEPCCFAVLKGTQQMAWLYEDCIEFLTCQGNVVVPALLEIYV